MSPARVRPDTAEAVGESEQRLREIIDSLPAAIYTTDAQGRLTHFNPAAVEFSGRVPDLGSDHWCVTWKLYYPDGTPMPHDQCPMAVALRERRAVRGTEAIAERPDGTRIWFEPYPTPLLNAEGELVGGINMLVDITERKLAERALRDSETRLSVELSAVTRMQQVSTRLLQGGDLATLLDDILGVAIEITRADMGNIQLLERGALKIVVQRGFEAPFLDFFNVHERQAACGPATQGGERVIVEDVANSPIFAGTAALEVMLAANARAVQSTPLTNRSGRVLGLFSTHYHVPHRPTEHELHLLDILARQAADLIEGKRAEDAMARLAAIVESSDDAIISTDLDGIITSWNRGAEWLYGYTVQEAIGQPITILIPPDRVDEERHILERVRRGERLEHYETVRRRKDGTLLDISLTVSPVIDGEGRTVGASKIARDITERKRTQEMLQHRGAQFETLLNQAPLGVYLVDADFRIREVNPVALPFFGQIPGGIVGRDLDEVIHSVWTKDYADEIVRIFRHTLATGEPYSTPERAEFRIDRGITEYYEWRLDRIHLPDGRYGVVCYFRDISAQVSARKVIEEGREVLREADRRKDEFLAMLSHELRTPLNAMLGWVRMLRSGSLDEMTAQRALEVVERNVHQQTRLISDLLDVSRIISGKLTLEMAGMDLAAVVASVVESMRPSAEAKEITLASFPVAGAVPVNGDSARLGQVVANLMSNAVKFTPNGGRVTVRLVSVDDRAHLSVSDTGKGISGAFLPHLFERYRQADTTSTRVETGLGLGLAIARHIVELHGGSIHAESAGEGKGATFTVELPIATSGKDRSVVDAIDASEVTSHQRAGEVLSLTVRPS